MPANRYLQEPLANKLKTAYDLYDENLKKKNQQDDFLRNLEKKHWLRNFVSYLLSITYFKMRTSAKMLFVIILILLVFIAAPVLLIFLLNPISAAVFGLIALSTLLLFTSSFNFAGHFQSRLLYLMLATALFIGLAFIPPVHALLGLGLISIPIVIALALISYKLVTFIGDFLYRQYEKYHYGTLHHEAVFGIDSRTLARWNTIASYQEADILWLRALCIEKLDKYRTQWLIYQNDKQALSKFTPNEQTAVLKYEQYRACLLAISEPDKVNVNWPKSIAKGQLEWVQCANSTTVLQTFKRSKQDSISRKNPTINYGVLYGNPALATVAPESGERNRLSETTNSHQVKTCWRPRLFMNKEHRQLHRAEKYQFLIEAHESHQPNYR